MTLTGVTAGSAIYVIALNADFDLTSCSDPVNGAYTTVDALSAPGDFVRTYVFQNAAAGTYAVTPASSSGYEFPWTIAFWVNGVTTTPLDGHGIVSQVGPGNGANALTVGPPSPPNAHAPVLEVGVFIDDQPGGGSDGNILVGTGFTLFAKLNPWGGTSNTVLICYKLIPSGTAPAVTATAGGSGTDEYVNVVAVFDQPASATDPQTPSSTV